MNNFSTEEKADAFDRISAHYYRRNFSSMSKANLDVLMFSIYLEHLIQSGEATDDYSISKELGISQTKVRTLKQNEMLQLSGSRADNWKQEFANYAKFARYDSAKKLVKMTIPEIIVLNELRHFIVQNGLYDEYQLNPRLFQCRLDVFVELCGLLEGEDILFDDAALEKLSIDADRDADRNAIELIRDKKWKEGLLKLSKGLLPSIIKSILSRGTMIGLLESLCNIIINS